MAQANRSFQSKPEIVFSSWVSKCNVRFHVETNISDVICEGDAKGIIFFKAIYLVQIHWQMIFVVTQSHSVTRQNAKEALRQRAFK